MKLIALLVAAITICSSASAVEFTVDQFTIDAVDIAPGDGSCNAGLVDPGTGGQCTLRAAIMETNAVPGADKILIPLRDPTGIPQLEDLGLPISEPIILDLTGEDTTAEAGDLDIQDDLTISVTPETLVIAPSRLFDQVLPIIDASRLEDRIFDVRPNIGDVQINGLVLTGGSVSGSGGALFVWHGLTGEVTLLAVDIASNSANSGAAVFARSPVSIINSRVRGNVADNNGAIILASATDVTVGLSSLYSNTAPGAGGVVAARSSGAVSASIRVLSSSITANDANGIDLVGDSFGQLQNVTVSGNREGIIARFSAIAPNPPSLLLSHTVLANSAIRNCTIADETTAAFQMVDDFNFDDGSSCDEIAAGVTNFSNIPAGLSGAAPDTQSWHWVDPPMMGSPLIDSGSETAVDFDMVGCVIADQRLLMRPRYGVEGADESKPARCDIGAIEFLPERLFANGFEP